MDTPMTEDVTESPLQIAQKALADAAMGVPMNPQGAAMSAYVNGILQSARIDALVELYVAEPNKTWSKSEAYEAALLGALKERTQALIARSEDAKRQIADHERRIEVASAMPGSTAAAVRNMTRN